MPDDASTVLCFRWVPRREPEKALSGNVFDRVVFPVIGTARSAAAKKKRSEDGIFRSTGATAQPANAARFLRRGRAEHSQLTEGFSGQIGADRLLCTLFPQTAAALRPAIEQAALQNEALRPAIAAAEPFPLSGF